MSRKKNRVNRRSISTSTIGGSTTATHSPDQTPFCLHTYPRLSSSAFALPASLSQRRSAVETCSKGAVEVHMGALPRYSCPFAPPYPMYPPGAPLFCVFRRAAVLVCFTKSYSYLSILPVALRHGGLICSLGDFKTSGHGGFLIPSPLPIPRMRFHVHACVFSARW